jgi:hypothetical protein
MEGDGVRVKGWRPARAYGLRKKKNGPGKKDWAERERKGGREEGLRFFVKLLSNF